MIDLDKLELPELRTLRAQVEAEIRRRGSKTQRAVKKLHQLAEEQGLSLSELFAIANGTSSVPTTSTRSSGVIKYRNPVDPNQGWTGHGRKPGWVVNYLANGGALNNLLAA
ncbi:MAG: H-NS histone family protein [Zoogloeaceae bacterium]|jgi:DNA-binding protein H-NS|nr:H-NS histone family protein [Zoogloeaceae bacterium]